MKQRNESNSGAVAKPISGAKRGREASRVDAPRLDNPCEHEIGLGFALDLSVDSDNEILTAPPAAKRQPTGFNSETSSVESSESAVGKAVSFHSLSIFAAPPSQSSVFPITPSSLPRTPKALDDLTAMARALSVVNSEGSDSDLEEEYGYPIIPERSQSAPVIGRSTFRRESLFEPVGIATRNHSAADDAPKKSALSL